MLPDQSPSSLLAETCSGFFIDTCFSMVLIFVIKIQKKILDKKIYNHICYMVYLLTITCVAHNHLLSIILTPITRCLTDIFDDVFILFQSNK